MTANKNGRNAFERVRDAVEAEGLAWIETESGRRARFQTPGHSLRHANDLGGSALYDGEQVSLHFFDEPDEKQVKDRILNDLGLSWADLFDNKEVRYPYTDGFVVRRLPNKVFRQVCKHNKSPKNCAECKHIAVRALYGIETISGTGPVYIVEGEKDVNSAREFWGASAVSQAQGAQTSPDKADWAPLIGRDLIIVADNDESGNKRARKVFDHLVAIGQPEAKLSLTHAAAGKDLTDHIAAGHGPDELVRLAERPNSRRVTLIPASSVKTERLDWLIPNWIPKRSLTLLAGREGLGKSTIACDIAAQATRGELAGGPMRVAYLATEDSPSITVKPRLQAAGANLDNVFFFEVSTETGGAGSLTLPGDTGLLTRALVNNNVHLVVLDAAKSAMHGSLDGYRDDDVRQFLEPLASMADNIAVIGLTHFGKRESADPGKLMLGSIAWSQIARSVLSVAPKEDGTLVVTNTKGNLARETVSREVRIVSATVPVDLGETAEVGRAEWGGVTSISAADLLAPRDEANDERGEIEAVVIDYLIENGGSAPASDVLKATRAAGLNDSAVKKARKRIGVKTEKRGMKSGWEWSIDFSKVPEGARALFRESSAPSGDSSPDTRGGSEPGSPAQVSDAIADLSSLEALSTPILEALSAEKGLSLARVQASLPNKLLNKHDPGQHLRDALDGLIRAGAVRKDRRGKYYRNEIAA
ncbi:AAA family ATPase [Corynebacterium sp. CNCTC7651]|uniref:AAA family ATPase n=1 Tax=Corynebacterium sp. CNCTC7651 TaxID=2815361 RepID=UPI001F2A9731|nr:AAA family ATPase [Corynebacterium sp. CNCTC7651]UIZ91789.1 AAA family ATPase [Corynebacterium sp. CNCTC7651]